MNSPADWQSVINRHYPNAVPLSQFRIQTRQWVQEKYQLPMNHFLLATSLCSDEVIQAKDKTESLHEPFLVGGLAGLPFGGETAMSAFFHHVPDGGYAVFIHGPHVGLNQRGELGRVERPGQCHDSACCGALSAALKVLQESPSGMAPELDENDLELSFLLHKLWPFRDRIRAADSPLKEIIDCTYEVIREMARRVAGRARREFPNLKVILLGIVLINTSPGVEDWVDVRDHEHV